MEFCNGVLLAISFSFLFNLSPLQTYQVYSALKRHGNGRFLVVLTWNTPGMSVGSKLPTFHLLLQRSV